jgi:hypothetical protein
VQGLGGGSPREREHSEDRCIDGGSGFIWLRIGTVGGLW